jgi:hypothetical protein
MPALGVVSGFALALPLRGLPSLVVIGMALIALWQALAEDDDTRLGPLGRALVLRWRRWRGRPAIVGADSQTAA